MKMQFVMQCQKFVTIKGMLIWLHELGLRGYNFEKAKELVFYKMNQKKELLSLEKCIEIGNKNCYEITKMFENKDSLKELKKLHMLGSKKDSFDEAIKQVNIACYYSDNDPYVKFEAEKEFADTISNEQYLISGGGHLNSESGYEEFNELIKHI